MSLQSWLWAVLTLILGCEGLSRSRKVEAADASQRPETHNAPQNSRAVNPLESSQTTKDFGVISVWIQYGPGYGLGLQLQPNGQFLVRRSGNVEPLFPERELGVWSGADPARTEALARGLLDIISDTPSTPLRPGAAFVSVSQETRGNKRERTYSLYEASGTWASVQQKLFETVRGPWLGYRERTVSVASELTAPQYRVGTRPMLLVTLRNSGTQSVTINEPVDASNWDVQIIPKGASVTTVEPTQLKVTPQLGSGAKRLNGQLIELAPASTMTLEVELIQALAPRTYELRVTLNLKAEPGNDFVGGTLTLETNTFAVAR